MSTIEQSRLVAVIDIQDEPAHQCPRCQGEKWLELYDSDLHQRVDAKCPRCNGKGEVTGVIVMVSQHGDFLHGQKR